MPAASLRWPASPCRKSSAAKSPGTDLQTKVLDLDYRLTEMGRILARMEHRLDTELSVRGELAPAREA